MSIVYAKTSATLAHAGQRVRVNAGEPWDRDDPLVKQYSEMFVESVSAVRTTQDPRGYREYTVERATAAPGEKRAVRRAPKRAESKADESADD
jgi:hypothetical protein